MARAKKRRDPTQNPSTGDVLLGGLKQIKEGSPLVPTSRRRVHGVGEMSVKDKAAIWVRFEETADLEGSLEDADTKTDLGSCPLEEWKKWALNAKIVELGS